MDNLDSELPEPSEPEISETVIETVVKEPDQV